MKHVAESDFSKSVEQLTLSEAIKAGKKVDKAVEIYEARQMNEILKGVY
jgi:hypothetical protein